MYLLINTLTKQLLTKNNINSSIKQVYELFVIVLLNLQWNL